MVLCAHPDDADLGAGGTIARLTAAGHEVRIVSVTNGDAGHQEMSGPPLAERRRNEAHAAGQILGADYRTLENHDARLTASIEVREHLIGLIRDFRPDLVLTHRPVDYHPDHRATATLVRDASYLLTVPAVRPDVPHMERMPTIAHLWDWFTLPYPFRADVLIPIDDTVEQKVDAIACHASQVYEWLPYNGGYLDEVPQDPAEQRAWLRDRLDTDLRRSSEMYAAGFAVDAHYCEAFEVSEYGSPLSEDTLAMLTG